MEREYDKTLDDSYTKEDEMTEYNRYSQLGKLEEEQDSEEEGLA